MDELLLNFEDTKKETLMKYGEHLTKCMTKGTPEEEKRKEDKIIAGLKKEMLIEMKEALTKAHAAKLIRKAKEKEEREKK